MQLVRTDSKTKFVIQAVPVKLCCPSSWGCPLDYELQLSTSVQLLMCFDHMYQSRKALRFSWYYEFLKGLKTFTPNEQMT